MVVAVCWLLKSYWNSDLRLFNLIEQKKMSQNPPFVITLMMPGPGHNQQRYPPSKSSGQPAQQAINHPTGSFISPLYYGSGGSNGGSQQHQHTLGLNCFAYPCHGVCIFLSSSFSSEPAEWPLNSEGSSTDQTGSLNDDVTRPGQMFVNVNDVVIINGLLKLQSRSLPGATGISCMLTRSFPPMETSETNQTTTESSQWDQSTPHLSQSPPTAVAIFTTSNQRTSKTGTLGLTGISPSDCLPSEETRHCQQTLSNHKRRDPCGQRICVMTLVGDDGQPHPCGKAFNNAQALYDHKKRSHTEQQTCILTVVGEDGQQRPCGKACKNALAMTDHKRRVHTGQKTCEVTVVGEDGQQQPCGIACKNVKTLSDHKIRHHTGQQTCYVPLVEEDGQQRPCGAVCKNARALTVHKSRVHSGQKTCVVLLVGEDGQQRQCGKICKNTQVLMDHKRRDHTGQQNCELTLLGENGQQRQCGKVCKNAQALKDHKRRDHTGQKICDFTVVGLNGLKQPCGKVCWSASALSDHKREHRKRKPVDVDQGD